MTAKRQLKSELTAEDVKEVPKDDRYNQSLSDDKDYYRKKCNKLRKEIYSLKDEKTDMIQKVEHLDGEVKNLTDKVRESGLSEFFGFTGSSFLAAVGIGLFGRPEDCSWVYYGIIMAAGSLVVFSSLSKLIRHFFFR